MPISPTSLDAVEFNSKAERDILLIAKKSKLFVSESTWLYYSLKINETGTAKIVGESDFVYLDSTHIFFLEVKGGEVRYDSLNNRWLVMGGQKEKDPFKQSSSLMFQVRDVLLPRLFDGKRVNERLVFGYGTMFPESTKPREMKNHTSGTIEYHADLIYDCYDFVSPNGFVSYINKLKALWTDRHAHKNRSLTGISSKEQKTISDYFRVNLHFRLPPSIILEKESQSLKHFTSFQSYILDNVALNPSAGAIVIGGPGTGKTSLAIELASQKESVSQSTLLICFNKTLASDLRIKLSSASTKVIHIHGLYSELMTANGWHYDGPDDENLFVQGLPLFICKKLETVQTALYEYLIIDEGQDLLNEYHFDVLDKLLKGGFRSGRWALFMDILNQNIYNKKGQEYLDFFRQTYPNFINKLSVNCRNTVNIIEYGHLLTTLPLMPCLRTDNYYKCHSKYGENIESIIKKIESEIEQLVDNDDTVKKHITILCYANEQVEMVKNSSIKAVVFEPGCQSVSVSSIHSFKGLENSYIFLIGPEKYYPQEEQQMSLLYIGVTRATTKCVVYFLDSNMESLLQQTEKMMQVKRD